MRKMIKSIFQTSIKWFKSFRAVIRIKETFDLVLSHSKLIVRYMGKVIFKDLWKSEETSQTIRAFTCLFIYLFIIGLKVIVKLI